MFLPKIARLKLIPWLVATAAIGFLPLGSTPSAQAQTVIYNGRTIVTEDYDRYDRDDRDNDRYDRNSRYDNYERYGSYERYDNDRYGRNNRYDNYDRDGSYERYGSYDRYDDYDRYERNGYPRRHIIIQERRSTGQDNPACLAFQSIRIACR